MSSGRTRSWTSPHRRDPRSRGADRTRAAPPTFRRVRGLRRRRHPAGGGDPARHPAVGRGRPVHPHRARYGAEGDGEDRRSHHHRGVRRDADLPPRRVPGDHRGLRRPGRSVGDEGVHPGGPEPVRRARGAAPTSSSWPARSARWWCRRSPPVGPAPWLGRRGRGPLERERESLGAGLLSHLGRGRRGRPEAGRRMATGDRSVPGAGRGDVPRGAAPPGDPTPRPRHRPVRPTAVRPG